MSPVTTFRRWTSEAPRTARAPATSQTRSTTTESTPSCHATLISPQVLRAERLAHAPGRDEPRVRRAQVGDPRRARSYSMPRSRRSSRQRSIFSSALTTYEQQREPDERPLRATEQVQHSRARSSLLDHPKQAQGPELGCQDPSRPKAALQVGGSEFPTGETARPPASGAAGPVPLRSAPHPRTLSTRSSSLLVRCQEAGASSWEDVESGLMRFRRAPVRGIRARGRWSSHDTLRHLARGYQIGLRPPAAAPRRP